MIPLLAVCGFLLFLIVWTAHILWVEMHTSSPYAYPFEYVKLAIPDAVEEVAVATVGPKRLRSIERRDYPEHGFFWNPEWDSCDIEWLYRHLDVSHPSYGPIILTQGIFGMIFLPAIMFWMVGYFNLGPGGIALYLLITMMLSMYLWLEVLTLGRFTRGRRCLKARREAVLALGRRMAEAENSTYPQLSPAG